MQKAEAKNYKLITINAKPTAQDGTPKIGKRTQTKSCLGHAKSAKNAVAFPTMEDWMAPSQSPDAPRWVRPCAI